MTSIESKIKALLDRRGLAAWEKDLDGLMSVFAPEVVYFDLVPPLRYTGAEALRERFRDWFGRWRGPIGQQISELEVLANDHVAAAHMLVRASGTLLDGREVDYWVRVSDTCRRSSDGWLITHEHVSMPVDLTTRSVVMDLRP
ncbi:YybH family protein [Microlunatus speluncae]|uniref:YybH family protein n=1 Tax=Microlunatus speluncae TaxID=2594267 RepID=UPI00126624B9|nr:nuclear transport factor 2 family protein [Microlunatus speluncae]